MADRSEQTTKQCHLIQRVVMDPDDTIFVGDLPSGLTIIEMVIIASAVFGTTFTVARALFENSAMRRAAEAPIRNQLLGRRGE